MPDMGGLYDAGHGRSDCKRHAHSPFKARQRSHRHAAVYRGVTVLGANQPASLFRTHSSFWNRTTTMRHRTNGARRVAAAREAFEDACKL